jgi:DNA-binding transcriptional LysR family regulator
LNADWDDLRVILGVWRGGSARRAGDLIGMSHATVARGIDALEVRLGVKVFDRLPTGYALTQDGEELVTAAQAIEAEVHSAQLKLTGRDSRLSGVIRVTTMDTVATHFLIPVLSQFSELYPEIEFELMIGYQSLDLHKREADIAIRGVSKPPEHLIGHRVASVAWTGYASQKYIDNHDISTAGNARWIGFGTRSPTAPWIKHSPLPHLPAWGSFDDVPLQIEAAKNHMGIAYIPCYVGDPYADLVRVLPSGLITRHELWRLRHRDTRSTARLRVFSEYVTEAFRNAQPTFGGLNSGIGPLNV